MEPIQPEEKTAKVEDQEVHLQCYEKEMSVKKQESN